MIKAVFFDVANTLLDKPGLYDAILGVLRKRDISIGPRLLAKRHRVLSEVMEFPDKTSKSFYQSFNSNLLLLLGIVPDDSLVNEVFEACTYLPWKSFDDVPSLKGIKLPKGVISNWDRSLPEKLGELVDVKFDWILGSEATGVRKPDIKFYETMIRQTGYKPGEILYVGDSVKLDILPALQVGVKGVLIDRLDLYPASPLHRIRKMDELTRYL